MKPSMISTLCQFVVDLNVVGMFLNDKGGFCCMGVNKKMSRGEWGHLP